MTVHMLAFLAGLFGVPIVLLAYGHKLRRRSARGHAAFWGAVIGHVAAAILAVSLGMIPPEGWTSEETWRGFIGLWGLLVFPVAGAMVALVRHRAAASAARWRATGDQ